MCTLLLSPTGRTQAALAGAYSILDLGFRASPAQKRHFLQVSAERTADGTQDLPNGHLGGYISTSGRRFWED